MASFADEFPNFYALATAVHGTFAVVGRGWVRVGGVSRQASLPCAAALPPSCPLPPSTDLYKAKTLSKLNNYNYARDHGIISERITIDKENAQIETCIKCVACGAEDGAETVDRNRYIRLSQAAVNAILLSALIHSCLCRYGKLANDIMGTLKRLKAVHDKNREVKRQEKELLREAGHNEEDQFGHLVDSRHSLGSHASRNSNALDDDGFQPPQFTLTLKTNNHADMATLQDLFNVVITRRLCDLLGPLHRRILTLLNSGGECYPILKSKVDDDIKDGAEGTTFGDNQNSHDDDIFDIILVRQVRFYKRRAVEKDWRICITRVFTQLPPLFFIPHARCRYFIIPAERGFLQASRRLRNS